MGPEVRLNAIKEEYWECSQASRGSDRSEQTLSLDASPADTEQYAAEKPILLQLQPRDTPCLQPAALQRVGYYHLNAMLQTMASGLRYLPAPRRGLPVTAVEKLIYDVSQQCDMGSMEEQVMMLADALGLRSGGIADMTQCLDAFNKHAEASSWLDGVFRCKGFIFDEERHRYTNAARRFYWIVHTTEGESLQE